MGGLPHRVGVHVQSFGHRWTVDFLHTEQLECLPDFRVKVGPNGLQDVAHKLIAKGGSRFLSVVV